MGAGRPKRLVTSSWSVCQRSQRAQQTTVAMSKASLGLLAAKAPHKQEAVNALRMLPRLLPVPCCEHL